MMLVAIGITYKQTLSKCTTGQVGTLRSLRVLSGTHHLKHLLSPQGDKMVFFWITLGVLAYLWCAACVGVSIAATIVDQTTITFGELIVVAIFSLLFWWAAPVIVPIMVLLK